MKAERLAAGALVLLFAAIYGLTLLPGIGPTGDNIKFQYVGRVLGVPHATGYPLYLVLNHLCTAPPLKSVAFRANLMSAVFAVLTLVFLFLALSRLTANVAAAFVASSFFGLTATFWSQAVVAEVYTLAAFFLALILWSLLEWRATGRDGYFLVFLCAYGLSLGNHLTVVAWLPAVLVFALLVAPGTFRRLKFWLFGLAALVVGVGQYGLLFLRTAQEAPYLEHEIRTLNDLVLLVTGHQFRSQMFAFSVKELLADRFPHFIRVLLEDITWPGLTLALAGLVFLFLRRRKVFVLCFLAILVQSIWILSTDIPDVETHMIPVSLICSLAAGFGLTSLMSLLRKRPPALLPLALVPLLAILGALHHARVDPVHDASYRHRLEQDRKIRMLLESIPPYSVILSDNYADSQNIHFRRLLDFREKNIIPHFLNPVDSVDIQVSVKLVGSILKSPELQERLGLREALEGMKDRSRDIVGLHLLDYLAVDARVRSEFSTRVYFFSETIVPRLKAEGVPFEALTLRSPQSGRKHLFYRLTLFDIRKESSPLF